MNKIKQVVKLHDEWEEMRKENPEEYNKVIVRIKKERKAKKDARIAMRKKDQELRESARLRKMA